MKLMILSILLLLGQLNVYASSSYECHFLGKIDLIESETTKSVNLKIHFLSRKFKTVLLGSQICKSLIGKSLSTTISSDDEYIKNLKIGNPGEITIYRICPEEVEDCFWDWNSNRLTSI